MSRPRFASVIAFAGGVLLLLRWWVSLAPQASSAALFIGAGLASAAAGALTHHATRTAPVVVRVMAAGLSLTLMTIVLLMAGEGQASRPYAGVWGAVIVVFAVSVAALTTRADAKSRVPAAHTARAGARAAR